MRNLEPPLAVNLELGRLSNFDIHSVVTPNRQVHVYEALPKAKKTKQRRLFARATVFEVELVDADAGPFPETAFVQTLDAMEVALGSRQGRGYVGNHIFLNVLAESSVGASSDAASYAAAVKVGYRRHVARLIQLRVATFEMRVVVGGVPIRLIATDESGFALCVDTYLEVKDTASGKVILSALSVERAAAGADAADSLDGKPVTTPYAVQGALEARRLLAQASTGTTYCYDFPNVFAVALNSIWRNYAKTVAPGFDATVPAVVMEATELVLSMEADAATMASPFPGLYEVEREPGTNAIGMVAWKLLLRTPVYPEGRVAMLISNDITTVAGSFGANEVRVHSLSQFCFFRFFLLQSHRHSTFLSWRPGLALRSRHQVRAARRRAAPLLRGELRRAFRPRRGRALGVRRQVDRRGGPDARLQALAPLGRGRRSDRRCGSHVEERRAERDHDYHRKEGGPRRREPPRQRQHRGVD